MFMKMFMKKFVFASALAIILALQAGTSFAQSEQIRTEQALIQKCLQNYLDGTSYNKPDSISKAFYPEANLFLSHKDKPLWIVPIVEYTTWFQKGVQGAFNGRLGRTVSIDVYGDIALAKAEILMPERKQEFMDMFLLKKIQGEWKIISKSAASKPSNKSGKRILFIASNAHFYGTSALATGNSYAEIVNAYHTFVTRGYTVDFVSPKGGAVPLAYINTSDTLQKSYLYNQDFMYAVGNTKTPKEIDVKNYKAVHYIGGGSAMFEVPDNADIQRIALQVYEENNGIISSVCHGTAGIAHLKTKDGKFLVAGKTVSGWPDGYEDMSAEYFKQFPFLIQKTIEERGGKFTFSGRSDAHVEQDGRIITGQNFQSSRGVALKIIEALENMKQ
jgi:putative intracellular protease/amidase